MSKLGLVAILLGLGIGVGYAVISSARRPEAPTSYAPLPWAEGQWRRHRVVERDGRETTTRISVVGRAGDGFWVEQEHTIGSGQTERAKVLFAQQPSTAEEALDAARAVEIRTVDGRTITWTSSDEKARPDDVVKAVAAVVVSTAGLVETTPGPLEDVSVAGGKFRQCMRADATIAGGATGRLMTGWFHPSVPLGGMIQGRTTEGESMELIDFGVKPRP